MLFEVYSLVECACPPAESMRETEEENADAGQRMREKLEGEVQRMREFVSAVVVTHRDHTTDICRQLEGLLQRKTEVCVWHSHRRVGGAGGVVDEGFECRRRRVNWNVDGTGGARICVRGLNNGAPSRKIHDCRHPCSLLLRTL